jgi:hypothetical protein
MHKRSPTATMGKRSDGLVHDHAAMAEDFRNSATASFLYAQRISSPTDINGIERALITQFVRHRSLKHLVGP